MTDKEREIWKKAKENSAKRMAELAEKRKQEEKEFYHRLAEKNAKESGSK